MCTVKATGEMCPEKVAGENSGVTNLKDSSITFEKKDNFADVLSDQNFPERPVVTDIFFDNRFPHMNNEQIEEHTSEIDIKKLSDLADVCYVESNVLKKFGNLRHIEKIPKTLNQKTCVTKEEKVHKELDLLMAREGLKERNKEQYIPDMSNWNRSFHMAKQYKEKSKTFTLDQEKKIKNWLKNQSKTKRNRTEEMSEKLYSIGEISYDNDIMLQRWKQDSKSKACQRWKQYIHKKRNSLSTDVKQILVEMGVFTWKEINKNVRIRKERLNKKSRLI